VQNADSVVLKGFEAFASATMGNGCYKKSPYNNGDQQNPVLKKASGTKGLPTFQRLATLAHFLLFL
jgi:hypothetical protein